MVESGSQVREGHNLVSNEHFRVFWEISNHSNYRTLYNGGPFSMFYSIYRDKTLYGKGANLVKYNKKVTLRNLSFHGLTGVSFGKRGDFIDAHVFKEDMIFTSEGKAIPDLNYNNSVVTLAFLNSSLVQYVINLYCGQHKHVGYVNILPFPELNSQEISAVTQNTERIIQIKKTNYSYDETNIEYQGLLNRLKDLRNLKSSVEDLQNNLINDHADYIEALNINDNIWLEASELGSMANQIIEEKKSNRPTEKLFFTNYLVEPSVFLSEICKEIIQFSFGIIFRRWKDESVTEGVGGDEYIFKGLPNQPFLVNKKGESSKFNVLSEEFVSNHNGLNKSLFKSLKSFFIEIGINIDDLGHYQDVDPSFGEIENFINNPSGFFNYHYLRYTKSRREAPIYWPISTESNSFIVWVYYPKLNENSLFKIVNELVEPKLDDIKELLIDLERAGTSKELHEQMALRDELEDFKEELLRVAQLPYKPNQDDGVLITAAPLHNLFRHTKWRKSTEACWKKLEKGEYDWAHLAYSIWPDRVTNKCKKDLSMAIAHGLESICEMKPKEKKSRKKPEIKVETQDKLL